MKQSIIAGAASGAASAALVYFGLQAGAGTPQVVNESVAAGPAAASPEAGRLNELGNSVQRLENDIEMIEGLLGEMRNMSTGQLATRTPVESLTAGLSAAEVEELKQLASVASNGDLGAVSGEYNAVRSTLEQIREEEERAEAEARRERSLERIEQDLERLTEDLGLVGYQTDGMRNIMTDELDKRTALMTEARESGDFGAMRDGARDIRTEAQGQIEELLGSDLYAEYSESNNNGRGGGFGGGGGGGGFGGGGGGGRGRGGGGN